MMRYLALIAAAAVAVSAMPAAASNLVQNGSFETLTNGLGQLGYNTTAVGWAGTGYNFVFGGSTADTLGAPGEYGGLTLYGPGNGHANGLGPSPFGGNFVGADGAFQQGAITQQLTGLKAGGKYAIKFAWGATQQNGFTGDQTESWDVKLGTAPTQSTATYHNTTAGFSGWMSERFVFVSTGTTATLSFLAQGSPSGVPPFSLLDGVVGSAVPEPATWAMMLGGIGLVGGALRARRRSVVAA